MTALIAGAAEALVGLHFLSHRPPYAYQSLGLLFLATAIMYRYLTTVKTPESFVQLYLFLIAFKLLVFLGFNIFMAVKNKAEAKYNVLFFLVSYILFTAVEIAFLYHRINRKNTPS
jgi:hypothetical protein